MKLLIFYNVFYVNNNKMDYNELKNLSPEVSRATLLRGDSLRLMRNYLGDLVDSKELEHLFVNDPEKEYYHSCSSVSFKECTHLHKCIFLIEKYPIMNDYLEEYLKVCDNINQVNTRGDTALHLSCRYIKTPSRQKTVEILINAGINVNIQNNYGNCALHFWQSVKEYIEILVNAGGDLYLRNKKGETPIDRFPPELQDYYRCRNIKPAIKSK